MELWSIYVIIAVVALILEMLIPSMFFLNFTLAGIITAIISLFWGSVFSLAIVFLFLSLFSLIFVKPFLKKIMNKENNADFKSDYIGKVVKSIEPITMSSGTVTIYEERWEARIKEGQEEIPADSDVKIVSHESLILFVEKV